MQTLPAGKDDERLKPEQIEALSFRIIDKEAGEHGFDSAQWPVVRRMIHTSADFDYLKTVRIHPKALSSGINAIRAGIPIITDTHMALAGIRKGDIARFGGSVICLMADPAVKEQASRAGTTRAQAAVDMAAARIDTGIWVIGNAPTALLRLLERIQEAAVKPELVIGLPVGFVNAAESKDVLLKTDVPHITNVGRKGGSNVAAAVVNALAIMAGET